MADHDRHLATCSDGRRWDVDTFEPQATSEPRPRALSKYPWGNVPAVDVLNLPANEGGHFRGPLRLLFAGEFTPALSCFYSGDQTPDAHGLASGDIRHVIKTISALPATFSGRLSVDVNDQSMDITARNALILLIFLTIEDPVRAATAVVHWWYSGRLSPECWLATEEARAWVHTTCRELRLSHATEEGIPCRKIWTSRLHQSSLTMDLTAAQWRALLLYLSRSALCVHQSETRRLRMMGHPADGNYALKMVAGWARCSARFRETGVLLPFGQGDSDFVIPNPTFLQDPEGLWPMNPQADPMSGWPPAEVFATKTVAEHDINGKLFFYLYEQFTRFHGRVRRSPVSFCILNQTVQDLVRMSTIRMTRFDRIEVRGKNTKERLFSPTRHRNDTY